MLTLSDLKQNYSNINLPSGGVFYKNGCNQIKLYHLNGNDLSILTDENLISNGTMIDVLLNSKVQKSDNLDTFIPPNQMTIGDRMTLLINLRLHLNNMYKIMLIDPVDQKPFETEFDLTTLMAKEVKKAKTDENGNFEFVFKKSHSDLVPAKFRLMIGLDEQIIRKKQLQPQYKKSDYLILKLTELCTSIGGNEDKAFIETFLRQADMNEVKEFNNYINSVSPGIDLNIKVTSPGGEIISTFLTFSYDFFIT